MTSQPPAAGDERAAINALWAATLLDALVAGGVRHACVSPGSRSTPLAWAVAERAGEAGATSAPDGAAAALTCSVHVDERAAAFFAVGYAAATGDAVALVCTSGTAAANYLPAVIEAHHSRLPLVVVTADRPAELRDRGAWQAIDQVKLYGDHVRWYHELGEASARPEALRYAAAAASRAVAAATDTPRGPVHLNVPLREPLGPVDLAATAALPPAATALSVAAPSTAPPAGPTRFAPPDRQPNGDAIAELAMRIAAEPRGLIVAGRPALDAAAAAAVRALAAAAGYPLLAEPLSGLRFADPAAAEGGGASAAPAVTGYDAFLRPDAAVDVPSPRLVVRIGGSVTWKHVADYLSRAEGAFQAAIDPQGTWDDPTGRIALRIAAPTGATCAALVDALAAARSAEAATRGPAEGVVATAASPATAAPPATTGADGEGWRAWWRAADAAVRGVRAAHVAPGGPGAEGGVGWLYPALIDILPPGAVLFAANSMAVRDLDTFVAPTDKPILPLCNRGAAGIDGTLSSAIGAAFGAGRPAALVTGDLAFLHDAGGFAVLADLANRYGRGAIDLTVVIVDDGGGGIFEHLPVAGADRARFEAFFATPQRVDLAALCAAWGVPCRAAPDAGALRAAAAVDAPVRAALVTVDRARNTAAHRAYWRAANDAVAAATSGRAAGR